jgi:valyl-tRNA synthetase
MKYDRGSVEQKWKNSWDKEKVYSFDEDSKDPLYVVDTPPPYVSADHLHAGHIMSYAQAEFIVRYKRMQGYNVYYPMGFDNNGLPTERFVEDKYNIDKSKISRNDFVNLCLEETKKGAEAYRTLWRDLGISVDWDYTYSTIDNHAQKISQQAFINLVKNGNAYRAEQPVMWCKTCQTTLSQADLENIDRKNTQTVNVHERCNTPVEFVSSKQWFIKINEQKQTWLDLGKKIKWHPDDKRYDYENWINNLSSDWCVSRQRYYGVPIPVWYDKNTGDTVLPTDDELPVDPTSYTPRGYNSSDLIPEVDVLDTWATSSISPKIIAGLAKTATMRNALYPADLRPNAHEIIRTWDFYSVVRGFYNDSKPPFKNVMISGHGLAEDGHKLSKRLGNYVPSEELVEKYGADALRYWATGAKLGQNLRFNVNEIEMGNKIANKLHNVAQFVKNHLDKSGDMHHEYEDVWIMDELNSTIQKVTDAFENYDFNQAKENLDSFFLSKLSSNYIEFIKYRLYDNDNLSANAAVDTLKTVFKNTLKMYAPILPFVTEEIYQELFPNEVSIHKETWPIMINTPHSLDISDFSDALLSINEIRKYKAERKMSLAKELAKYSLKQTLNYDKYSDLVSKVMRVRNLS